MLKSISSKCCCLVSRKASQKAEKALGPLFGSKFKNSMFWLKFPDFACIHAKIHTIQRILNSSNNNKKLSRPRGYYHYLCHQNIACNDETLPVNLLEMAMVSQTFKLGFYPPIKSFPRTWDRLMLLFDMVLNILLL